jgi:hypothetical protein
MAEDGLIMGYGFRRLVVGALFLATLSCSAPTATPGETTLVGKLPAKAETTPALGELYRWAVAHHNELKYIPCTCGCVDEGHGSAYSCFVKGVAADGTVTYDEHGAYCGTCQAIAKDTRQQLSEGKSLAEIRRYIDSTYSGKPTNTPYPPE